MEQLYIIIDKSVTPNPSSTSPTHPPNTHTHTPLIWSSFDEFVFIYFMPRFFFCLKSKEYKLFSPFLLILIEVYGKRKTNIIHFNEIKQVWIPLLSFFGQKIVNIKKLTRA